MKANPVFSQSVDGSANKPVNKPSEFGITEIVLPQTQDALHMILPMLAYRSQGDADRWFTWVNPVGFDKATLLQYGFNLNVLRRIDVKTSTNHLSLFDRLFEALITGNSQTVVACPGKLSKKQLDQLDMAAQLGQCSGLLIRFRD